MLIDGTNLILGRLATYVAKQALLGEKITIVNCESVCISGNKVSVKEHYKERQERGHPLAGPFPPKMADRIVRRAIRGMLPYKQLRGKEAFKNIKCYLGVPAALKNEKIETLKSANISKLSTMNYISIGEISKHLGRK